MDTHLETSTSYNFVDENGLIDDEDYGQPITDSRSSTSEPQIDQDAKSGDQKAKSNDKGNKFKDKGSKFKTSPSTNKTMSNEFEQQEKGSGNETEIADKKMTKPKTQMSPEDERILAFFGSFFDSDEQEDENADYGKLDFF